MHSSHTALSNYSTIAAAQVMEFQLKYVSFRICFCREESEGGCVLRVLKGEGMDGGEGLVQEIYFAAYVLYLSTTHTSLIGPSSIKEMAYFRHFMFRCTLRLESGQKRLCFDKKSLQRDAENGAF